MNIDVHNAIANIHQHIHSEQTLLESSHLIYANKCASRNVPLYQTLARQTDKQADSSLLTTDRIYCRLRGRREQQDLLPTRTTPPQPHLILPIGRLLQHARCAENITEKSMVDTRQTRLRYESKSRSHSKSSEQAQHEVQFVVIVRPSKRLTQTRLFFQKLCNATELRRDVTVSSSCRFTWRHITTSLKASSRVMTDAPNTSLH